MHIAGQESAVKSNISASSRIEPRSTGCLTCSLVTMKAVLRETKGRYKPNENGTARLS